MIENITNSIINSNNMSIVSTEQYVDFSNKLSTLKKLKMDLENQEKELTNPIYEHIKLIREKFLDSKNKINEAIKILTNAMLSSDLKSEKEIGSSVSLRKILDFDVLNIKDVPIEYLELNREAVRKDINCGVRKIPGLVIFEKEILAAKIL